MPIYLIFRHFMGIWTLWFSGSNGQVRAGATTYIQQFRQLKKKWPKRPRSTLGIHRWQLTTTLELRLLLAKLATRHTSVVKNWVSSLSSPIQSFGGPLNPNVLLEPMTSPICCQNDCFFSSSVTNSTCKGSSHSNRKTNSIDPMKNKYFLFYRWRCYK